MDDHDDGRGLDDELPYGRAGDIDPSALNAALCGLHLLGDDPFFRMQALNLSIVDQFVTNVEYEVLQKLIAEERTPAPEAAFLSAQSQMWMFAAYELLRTWRQRATEMINWAENGGLAMKRAALEREQEPPHFGRQIRASQIRDVLADPGLVDTIRRDVKRAAVLFMQLEAIRISLAKHEVWRNPRRVALRPATAGSICGAAHSTMSWRMDTTAWAR